MEFDIGTVVISLKGRDKNRPMCIIAKVKNGVMVCDGKERPLQRPKFKNPKHIRVLESKLSAEEMVSDRALKKALKLIPEAYLCQNRI